MQILLSCIYLHVKLCIIQVLFRQYILIICFEFCFILLTSFTVTVWFSQKLKNWHKTYSIHVHVYIRIFTKFKQCILNFNACICMLFLCVGVGGGGGGGCHVTHTVWLSAKKSKLWIHFLIRLKIYHCPFKRYSFYILSDCLLNFLPDVYPKCSPRLNQNLINDVYQIYLLFKCITLFPIGNIHLQS